MNLSDANAIAKANPMSASEKAWTAWIYYTYWPALWDHQRWIDQRREEDFKSQPPIPPGLLDKEAA